MVFLPDRGSLGLTSSTTSSCTDSSSGPWDEWSATDSLFSFPRPTIFMKDRRRLLESHSLSEQFSSPLNSFREPMVSRYFPANLGRARQEKTHRLNLCSSLFSLTNYLLLHSQHSSLPHQISQIILYKIFIIPLYLNKAPMSLLSTFMFHLLSSFIMSLIFTPTKSTKCFLQ